MLNFNNNCFPMNPMNQPNLSFQFNPMNQINQMNQMNMFNNNIQPMNQMNAQMNFNQINNINNNYNNYNQFPSMNNMAQMPMNSPMNIYMNNMNNIQNNNTINFQTKVNNDLKLNLEHNRIITNELTDAEYYLYRFFKMVEMDSAKLSIMCGGIVSKKELNKNGVRIYVNYYNIIKSEIYVDLNLQIDNIIANILKQIFCPSFEENIKKCFYNYLDILYIEFKGINLIKIFGKTGKELGLKEGDEFSLKLGKELFNEIYTFPKEGSIHLKCNGKFLGHFIPRKGGLTKDFMKYLINHFNYFTDFYSSNSDNIFPGTTIIFSTCQSVMAGKKN